MNCSMNFKVIPTPTFAKSLKALAKRHKSMKADMDAFRKSLEEDPFQGTELTPGVRKIRMAITSKGGGKSGGARVITYNVLTTEQDGKVYLMEIYDKSDAQTVKLNVIKEWIKELLQIVTTREFRAHQKRYFDLAEHEKVYVTRKNARPIVISVADDDVIHTPNAVTLAAMQEAQSGKALEELDVDNFRDFVASL